MFCLRFRLPPGLFQIWDIAVESSIRTQEGHITPRNSNLSFSLLRNSTNKSYLSARHNYLRNGTTIVRILSSWPSRLYNLGQVSLYFQHFIFFISPPYQVHAGLGQTPRSKNRGTPHEENPLGGKEKKLITITRVAPWTCSIFTTTKTTPLHKASCFFFSFASFVLNSQLYKGGGFDWAIACVCFFKAALMCVPSRSQKSHA